LVIFVLSLVNSLLSSKNQKFMIMLFSISMFFNKEVSKIQAFIGLIVIIIANILFISFLPLILEGKDLMRLMTSTSSELAITRF